MPEPELRAEILSFVRDGDALRGYATWRPSPAPLPAVVLLPDVHGLSGLYRTFAQRFAEAGFLAFVLDIYSREGAPALADMEQVFAWIGRLDDRRILADVAGAVAFVGGLEQVRAGSVGITGFCLGGQYALMAACTVPGLAAAVSFYGMLRYSEYGEHKPRSALDMAAELSCPYLGLFGAEDVLIPQADVRELEATLRRAGKDASIHVYPGAGHAFCNEGRADAYRPEAARDAFERAYAFFRRHLA